MSNHNYKNSGTGNNVTGKQQPQVTMPIPSASQNAESDNQVPAPTMMTVETGNGQRVINMNDLEAIVAAISPLLIKNANSPSVTKEYPVSAVNQYLPEDHLDEPVVFFSMRLSYVDYGAKRGDGTYHLPPFVREDVLPNAQGLLPVKPIEFKFSHTETKINIGEQTIEKMQFCSFVCRNKKELDYLLNHPKLGIEFWKATDKMTTKDTLRARAISDAHKDVESMQNDVVIERLSLYGLQISQNMGDNRTRLMNHLADMRLQHEHQSVMQGLELAGASSASARDRIFQHGSAEYNKMAQAVDAMKDE
jgi:hypothetical protein